MPRRIKVNSLVTICVDNICLNMDSFWCTKHWEDIYSSPERVISEVGPFEYLPDSLLNEIKAKLKENHLLEVNVMSSLITSTLVKLTPIPSVHPLIFYLISHKCQDTLKEVNLSSCEMDIVGLMKAIKSLRNLEVLNLDRTYITDEVLSTVGSHCSELRRLSLNGCWWITCRGLEYLFEENSTEDGVHRYGKCKLLDSLHVESTAVGERGAEIALRNAPNLKHLDHPDVVSVLGRMHLNHSEDNPLRPYGLISLRAGHFNGNAFLENETDARLLSIATRVCPHVTDVILKVMWDTADRDVLLSLSKLKNLKNLDIDCSGGERIDVFFSEVSSLLSVSGHTIRRLHLVGIPTVDVRIIGLRCPLLEDLCISIFCEDVEELREEEFSAPASEKTSFAILKFLNLSMGSSYRGQRDGDYCDITRSQWKEMLSSRLLESLTIDRSSSLTDSVLSDVIKAGQEFPNLKKLNLSVCSSVTKNFVNSILNLPNALEVVSVHRCINITSSDFDSLKSFCKVNGFDVDMEFYE